MKLRTVRMVYYLMVAAAVLVVVMGYSWNLAVYGTACVGLLLAMMTFLQTYWRCPLCGQPLGRMQMGAVVTCPHCRKKLEV